MSCRKFCRRNNIKLVFVGPEVPLVEGIVDLLEDNGIDTLLNREDRIRLMKQKEKE